MARSGQSNPQKGHLSAFTKKMEEAELPPVVIDTFAHYYEKVITGETGMIRNSDIQAISPDEIEEAENLSPYTDAGKKAFENAVMIVLNGGLGTSMGLTGPKSLLEVKEGKRFIDIIVEMARQRRVTLALMNSFSTHQETEDVLSRMDLPQKPITFLQHKFPKILQSDLSPAEWSDDPDLEWNPPGHGDIYTALLTSGMLDRLLDSGIEYAFICNSDNLGASMEPSILGYFAEKNYPFMMEVARRTPSDMKGGHLARHKEGYLLLREAAQCPEDEMDAFTDIERYRFFNTNNLWVNLKFLKDLIAREKTIRLPMILNPKTLDPRDEKSPPVYQVETAMGAAISLFPEAAALAVSRSRFFPVKKSGDLLAVRSDRFLLDEKDGLILNPENRYDDIKISLDSEYYKKIDGFDARFPEGVPSLKACSAFSVSGDVRFEKGIVAKEAVKIENSGDGQAVVMARTLLEGDLTL